MSSAGEGVGKPADSKLAAVALGLLRMAKRGVLATISSRDGGPYASLVMLAPDVRGEPIFLFSRLAWHTRNILVDSRASVLIEAEPYTSSNLAATPRVSLLGRAVPSERHEVEKLFASVHPKEAQFLDMGDFSFFRFVTTEAHFIAGFGQIKTLSAAELFAEN